MYLPQTTEYALRAMACLVDVPEGEGLRSADIAARSSVPLAYLQKVLRRLVEAGLLDSQKGHGGGFKLARDPRQITFRQILEATEVELDATPCGFGWERCDALRPCPLHPAYAELQESVREWAGRLTLADTLHLQKERLTAPTGGVPRRTTGKRASRSGR